MSIPNVLTLAATAIISTGFTANGNIVNTGGYNPTAAGFVYMQGTSGSPHLFDEGTLAALLLGTFSAGPFSMDLSGFLPNTGYRVRAWAQNSDGISYGETVQVTTAGVAPPPPPPEGVNRFWVGGSGEWNDTSHWSSISGGPGGASVPTLADAVYIDEYSLSAGDTITGVAFTLSSEIITGWQNYFNAASNNRWSFFSSSGSDLSVADTGPSYDLSLANSVDNFSGFSTRTGKYRFYCNASISDPTQLHTFFFHNVRTELVDGVNSFDFTVTAGNNDCPIDQAMEVMHLADIFGPVTVALTNVSLKKVMELVDTDAITIDSSNMVLSVQENGNFSITALPNTRYWVGGTGNTSDTNHWSTTSGGAGGAPVPTAQHDVFFDDNSFSSTGQTVTVDETLHCHDIDFTGVLNSPTISEIQPIEVSGNIVLGSGPTYYSYGAPGLSFYINGTCHIESNGQYIQALHYWVNAVSPSILLEDNLSVGTISTFGNNAIILDTNGHDLNVSSEVCLFSQDINGATAILDGSTIDFSGDGYGLFICGNVSMSAIGTTINIPEGAELELDDDENIAGNIIAGGPESKCTLNIDPAVYIDQVTTTTFSNVVISGTTLLAPLNDGNINGGGNTGIDFTNRHYEEIEENISLGETIDTEWTLDGGHFFDQSIYDELTIIGSQSNNWNGMEIVPTDTLGLEDYGSGLRSFIFAGIFDTLFAYEELKHSWAVTNTESLVLTDTLAEVIGLMISDWLTLIDTQTNNWNGRDIISDTLNLFDISQGSKKYADTIDESLVSADAAILKLTVTTLEYLGFTDLVSALKTMAQGLSDGAFLYDVSSVAYAAAIQEALSAVDSAAVMTTFIGRISESLGLSDLSSLIKRVSPTVTSSLVLSESISNKGTFYSAVYDTLSMNVTVDLDGEVYECYVLNTPKFMPSMYSGFDFNSYCVFENRAFGANSVGIYELTGTTDAGATIRTGAVLSQTDFGAPNQKRFRRGYLGVSGTSPVVVLETEDGGRQAYTIDTEGKTVFSHDQKSKKWKLAVADFDELDSIKLIPIVLSK